MKFLLNFLVFSVLFVFFPAHAKIFNESEYISFEIPDSWNCKAFGQNWVCHDKYQERKVEALITVTAKIAGSFDTRENYMEYLNQEKSWFTRTKEQITSTKLIESKLIYPNKFPWAEGIHKNSEIKSYISRYVGTVCCKDSSSKLGILVVLSAHEDHWKKYAPIFLTAINSLSVLDIEEAISKVRASEALGGAGAMNLYMDALLDEGEGGGALSDAGPNSTLSDPLTWGVLGLAVLVVLVLLVLKRKKKRRKRRSRK